MLTALVLASLAQFPVFMGQQETVGYELQTMTYQQYVPVIRSVPTVTYSVPVVTYGLPVAYYGMRVDPLVRVYSPYLGGRTVVKERWPGFRGKTVFRH